MGEDQERAHVAVQVLSQISPKQCAKEHEVCEVLMDAFWKVGLSVQRQIVSVAASRGTIQSRISSSRYWTSTPTAPCSRVRSTCWVRSCTCPRWHPGFSPLLHHQYDDVKEAALEACIAIGGDEVRERFVAMSGSDEPVDRLMAVYALGKLDATANRDILTQALEDEIPDIRKVAVEALASGADDAWRPLVLSKLNDESKDVG